MEDDLFNDLIQSVEEMKKIERGECNGARATSPSSLKVADIRHSLGLSQTEFGILLGVSKGTLTNWEQGRRTPGGAAKTLLKIAAKHPEVVLEAANS